jgi:hypothetical protein
MDNKDIGCISSNNFADIKYYSASCKTTSRRFSKRIIQAKMKNPF